MGHKGSASMGWEASFHRCDCHGNRFVLCFNKHYLSFTGAHTGEDHLTPTNSYQLTDLHSDISSFPHTKPWCQPIIALTDRYRHCGRPDPNPSRPHSRKYPDHSATTGLPDYHHSRHGGNTHPSPHCGGYPDADSNTNYDPDSDANRNPDADSDSDSNPHADSDSHSNTYPNAKTPSHPSADSQAHTHHRRSAAGDHHHGGIKGQHPLRRCQRQP